MTLRSKLMNDFTGFAGLAYSATRGIREEIRGLVKAQVDELISTLNLVRKEEIEVVEALAVKARKSMADLELRVTELETRLAEQEERRPAHQAPKSLHHDHKRR